MFTARYGLSLCITRIGFVLRWLNFITLMFKKFGLQPPVWTFNTCPDTKISLPKPFVVTDIQITVTFEHSHSFAFDFFFFLTVSLKLSWKTYFRIVHKQKKKITSNFLKLRNMLRITDVKKFSCFMVTLTEETPDNVKGSGEAA